MTEAGISFLADVVLSSSVMTIRPGAGIDQVEQMVGSEGFVDDVDKRRKSMRRDYGLIEFGFNRDPGEGWRCSTAIVQVHRLQFGISIPASISKRYGDIPAQIAFEDLRVFLASRGVATEAADVKTSGYSYYKVNSSSSRIIVADDGVGDELQSGSIWSIVAWW